MRSAISISILLLLGVPAVAHAQSSTAQAEQDFKDGQAKMKAGNYAAACISFKSSQKAQPAINTLINLAACFEKNEQIASAYGAFIDVVSEAKSQNQPALGKVAQQHVADLEPRLSYVIINVPDDSKVEGLTITMNGQLVDPDSWNRKIPEDGGHYKIEGKAPAHEPWSTEVDLLNTNDQKSVDVPKFKAVPIADKQPTDGDAGDGEKLPGGEVDTGSKGLTGKRKAALGLGGLGVVAAVGAVILELGAEGKYDDAKKATSDTSARSLTDDANGKRHLAMGAAGIGVAALGVGAFLWFTGGATHEARDAMIVPAISASSVGFAWTGSF